MNKKLFNKHLMGEAMRQVRLPGVIGTVLLMGISFFTIFIESVNAGYGDLDVMNYYFQEKNQYIMLVMYTFAPVMVMMLLGFMNKRRASDFYHALPFTRVCVYVSCMSAVFLWCVIMITAGSFTTMTVAWLSDSICISMSSAVKCILDAVAGVMLTMSVMAFAMTLTGTYLTNVITAILFLFAPRGVMMLCEMLFHNALPFAVFQESSVWGSACNIPFGLLTRAFGVFGFSDNSVYSSWLPLIYTTVLGLIYFASGAVCFIKRKSENATMASVNRGLQCFLRIIPTVLISFVSISIMFNAHASGKEIGRSDLFVTIMAYAAAIAVYFLYEIITTRRVANLLKIIPGLGIVVIVNLALYFGLSFSYDYHIAQLPEKQELEYVVVHGPEDSLLWKDTMDVRLYSEEARAVVSDCLKDTVGLWLNKRNGSGGFYNQYYSGNCMIVEYHYQNGKTILRKVIVNRARYTQLKNALVHETGFTKSFGKSIYDLENMEYSVGCLDPETAEAVYNIFLAEIGREGVVKLFEIVDDRNDYGEYLFQISLWDKRGRRYSSIYIGTDMPFTAIAYMNAINKRFPGNEFENYVESAKKVGEMACQDENDTDIMYLNCSLDIEMYTVRPDGSLTMTNSYSSAYYDYSYAGMPSEEGLEDIAKLGRLIKPCEFKPSSYEPGQILLFVSYYEYTNLYVYDEYGNMTSKTISSGNDQCDYGWYMIDNATAELIRRINMDENVFYER